MSACCDLPMFELHTTVYITAETADDADRLFCDLLDGQDRIECWGWTTMESEVTEITE